MPAHRWEDVLTNINSVWLACADTAAATLSSQVTPSVIENLLAAAETSATTNGRGIATRILGRFAEQGSGSIAGSLVLDTYRAEIIAQMLERLDVDSGDIILEHAFWVIDSFYYPQLDLKDRAVRHFKYLPNSVALRFRALGVYGRLLVPYYGDTQIPDDEASMFVDGVRDPSPYIRAQAAFVASTLAYSRPPVSAEQRAAILSALSEQFALETETQAKGYIAWALDAFSGSSHYQEMKLEYEAVHLPRTLSAYGITIRSALPLERMQEYLTTLDNLRRAYFNIISPEVVTPIADDPHSSVTLVLFGSIARYREYMSLWGGCCAYAGGVYFEGSATFYTFDRQSWESSFTTPQLVKHEFTHYLNGRHVHPGSFADAGYAFWKRAWQDEGFAEVMAGIEFDSNGDYTLLPHGYHGSAICRSRPTVAPVLNSSFYSTDFYTHSWAMNYFLLTEHKAGLDTIFNAYRDSSYQRDNFSSLAGFSSEAEFESSLNGAIDRWCAAPHAASVQTQDEFQHFDRGDSVSSRGFVSPGSPMLRRP